MIKARKAKSTNKRERTDEEQEQQEEITTKIETNTEPPRKKLQQDSIKNDKGERVNLDEYLSNTFKASKTMRTEAFDKNATAINTLEFDENDTTSSKSSSETKSKSSLLNNELHGRGPQKGSKFIRVTARFDYEPNICKDYYETGFCGYGLNCIYAHYREEYKSGNQIEKEWKEEQKKSTTTTTADTSSETTNTNTTLPFACHICRKAFTDPVVTICKHYFCSACAIQRYNGGKNPKCAVCGQNTQGIFNTAHAITKQQKIAKQ